MNVAIVTAGGSGVRTGYKVPKQFLTVYDIPIIVYTLQNISRHSDIERIVVVVPEGWQSFVQAYTDQYDLKKVSAIVLGGETRFQSVIHGVEALLNELTADQRKETLVGIYDGNRPLVPAEVTTKVIESAKQHGAAVALEPCYDTMVKCLDDTFINEIVDRTKLFKGQCPEFIHIQKILDIVEQHTQTPLTDLPVYALLQHLGQQIAFVNGSSKSFKITTSDDIELFKALVKMEAVKST